MNNEEKVWNILEKLGLTVTVYNDLHADAVTINNKILVSGRILNSPEFVYVMAHEIAHFVLHTDHRSNSIKNEAEANRWAIKFLTTDVHHIRSYVEFMQINGIPGKLIDMVQDVLTPIVLSRVE
ncbi:ImmA/IrrE family metallo-endopeptidase [Leuconostoc mesenteroides]|uniref:ImmA/IrrE family metallo-endopeptidase n=1 Tax=Leuconostoc mesenteroides TaxID=1245 RepID=UPI000A0208CD|nr:ImmA/IrrE family metallo-endopeptidase [Leuconostoc mesenteroides]ORI39668.1 ImmA/IrrE family metallo-endopeptidase [Leuconostoc mesenteroides subsp. cremoris]ORI42537.1 ImmA/IrrE family metallo-endopeptidase [Leuconostoc mesenteroides subsp. cremoris]ORI44552.1 ImmA/IrrE family metallo-endopeptidase [Leuconostoc mesenteroides subsp. cremoris]